MKYHNRLYSASLGVLGVLTSAGAGMLFYLTGASGGGAVGAPLPDWSLPWVAIISFGYAIAIVVTLGARRFDPERGRALTRALNWALLPAVPGGTLVGLYGLLRADRDFSDRSA